MTEIYVPMTGEVVTLPGMDLSVSDIELIELLQLSREFRVAVVEHWETPAQNELLKRMDRNAKWTIHSGDFTATGSSPAPIIHWDTDALARVLNDLVGEGLIDKDLAIRAVEVTVAYKPQTGVIKAIRKLSPEIAERIDECATEEPPHRRISVKPRRAI